MAAIQNSEMKCDIPYENMLAQIIYKEIIIKYFLIYGSC